MILIDTSVWIDHFSRNNETLAHFLEEEQVLIHPLALGELAVGNLKNRKEILQLLAKLPIALVSTSEDVLYFIEKHGLMGRGLGIVDVHLLASTIITEATKVWTNDKRLHSHALDLGVAY